MTNKITKLMLNGEGYEIREYQSGWQPGANTVFYYKFNNNLNDEMGNYDLSQGSGSQTITYGTTSGGATYAYFSTNCWSSQSSPISGNWDDEYTMSFWVNAQSAGQHILLDTGNNSGRTWARPNKNIEIGYIDQQQDPSYNIGTGAWYYITIVKNNTYSKFYVNGNLETTGTPWPIYGDFYLVLNNARDTHSFTASNNAYLSELIFEKGAWTAQEVSDYYNQTKFLYGIS